MEWDTVGRGADIELSSNCLTATKSSSVASSTVRGTILYADLGCHEFHVILDSLGPDGIWVGVASPTMDSTKCVGDLGCGWALHSDGDRRFNGREEEFTSERPLPAALLASPALLPCCHTLLLAAQSARQSVICCMQAAGDSHPLHPCPSTPPPRRLQERRRADRGHRPRARRAALQPQRHPPGRGLHGRHRAARRRGDAGE